MDKRHLQKLTEAKNLIEEVAIELPIGSPEWQALIGPLAELEEIVNPHKD